MRRWFLIAVLTLALTPLAHAQETLYSTGDPRVTFIEIKADQVSAVMTAWNAVHRLYEPNADIGDFNVTYTALLGRPPTVAFGKMRAPAGERFHFYQVVVDRDGAHIVTADQSGSLH